MTPSVSTLVERSRTVGKNVGQGINIAAKKAPVTNTFAPPFKIIHTRQGVYSSSGKIITFVLSSSMEESLLKDSVWKKSLLSSSSSISSSPSLLWKYRHS